MGSRVRTGFKSYLETGEFTPDFIDDVSMLIGREYKRWTLYEDADDFFGFCWAKIVRSMQIYEEQDGRSQGPLSNYLIQVIRNEAQRLYSKHSKMGLAKDEDIQGFDPLWNQSRGRGSLEDRDRVCTFARLAFVKGVWVDQKNLYRNYLLGHHSPAVKAFMWSGMLGHI